MSVFTLFRKAPQGRKPSVAIPEAAYGDLLSAALGQAGDPERFFLKPGYISRDEPKYYAGSDADDEWQPDVYRLAQRVASPAAGIVDVGCAQGGKLMKVAGALPTVGIDFGDNLEYCRKTYPGRRWEECDLDRAASFPLRPEELRGAVLVCADVIEHLKRPDNLLRLLREALAAAACLLLSTPERDLTRGLADCGPPSNPAHLREWNLPELVRLMTHFGLPPTWAGLTRAHESDEKPTTSLILVKGRGA
jgi:hypothetical protein